MVTNVMTMDLSTLIFKMASPWQIKKKKRLFPSTDARDHQTLAHVLTCSY
jgi:hypothetical protein